MNQCERSAEEAGWYQWFGIGPWVHLHPWDAMSHDRPHYIIGTARDVCLLQGLETGDTTL